MEPTLIISTIIGLVNKIFPTDSYEVAQKKIELESQIVSIVTTQMAAQAEINKVEAQSSNVFVAGWRPAIGWICAISFAYGFVIKDFIDYYLQMKGLPSLPEIDTKDLMVVMTGMLGIGGIDALTKVKGLIGK